jgi:hypothetical protein
LGLKKKTTDTTPTHDWTEHWNGMPEFVQEKQTPYAKIIFRFANEEALQEFSKLIGQKLTAKTKSAWHPELVRGIHSSKRYVDEKE